MTPPLRLIVFDCDGTLVDSQATIVECATLAFERCGAEPPAPAAIRRIVGLSLQPAMRVLLGRDDPDLTERIASAYKDAFVSVRSRPGHEEPLFPGTLELLERLDAAGMLMGVATGKSRRGLDAVIARHGLEGRFVTLQTADGHPSKPHPSMLRAACGEAGIAPAEAAIVGDTTFDVEMGLAAGCRAVGVDWGNHPRAELEAAGAEAVLSNWGEFSRIVG